MNVVELRNMSKSFGSMTLFNEYSISISDGEYVSITGRSGSGKSTLLNIIGLLDTADNGELVLFGYKNPTIDSRIGRTILREKISYLFQNYALIDEASVRDNLKLATRFLDCDRTHKREIISQTLDMVGMAGTESKKIYELSGGEQQRVAIAKAIIKPSRLILADEPTGSLDANNRDAILELLSSLHKEGKTIIIVTHDPVVAKCANRNIAL